MVNENEPVQFIRLITGEDLVAEVVSVNIQGQEPYYILNHPMKVVYGMPTKPGYYSVGLGQWVSSKICSDQSFTIYPTEVLTMATPTDALIEYYLSSIDYYDGKKEETDPIHEEEEQLEEEPLDDSDILEKVKEALGSIKTNKTLH